MSTRRFKDSRGFIPKEKLPKGPNGRACCRQCGEEVPQGRRAWCSQKCVDEHRIRTDAGYVRLLLFRRDKGVCALCGLDTVAAHVAWQQSRPDYTKEPYKANPSGYTLAFRAWEEKGRPLGFIRSDSRNSWDADHIVPVCEGGGECGIDNFRTLCCPCHKQVSAELTARRAKPKAPKEPKPTTTQPDFQLALL